MINLLNILCSIPVILLITYFLPVLGVFLIIARYFIKKDEKFFKMPLSLVIVGVVLLIPNIVNSILKNFKLKVEIPYLKEIISSDIYPKLVNYSKLIITLGIIFLVLSYIVKNLINRVGKALNEGINDYVEEEHNRSQENNLKMKEKQERAKNTHVVKCPHCGASNMLTEKTGVCKFCRKPIE